MGKFIRMMSADGFVTAIGLDSSDIVSKAEQIHKTSAVVTAALGRQLTITALMGRQLKTQNASVTTRITGDGPIGIMLAVSDHRGYVRGYAEQAIVEIPLKSNGKLDVSTAIGANGSLTVSKDLKLREPYVGTVALETGEVAEDFTSYFAASEQTPTVCAAGVLVNPDLSVAVAGGFIIQLLPGAGDDIITKIEDGISKITSITDLMSNGKSIKEILEMALVNFQLNELGNDEIIYNCNCCKDRFERGLISLGAAELGEMANQNNPTEITCQFCAKKYTFTSSDIKKLKKISENV